MKTNGIIVGVIGIVLIILSQSGIFKAEIRPGLGLYNELTAITYPLLGVGLVLLIVGAILMAKGKS
jgi:hypothetical protein